MVILKISTDTGKERQVEIVNEEGTWRSGNYHIFESAFLKGKSSKSVEPHNVNNESFLGEINIEKEIGSWVYEGNKLDIAEQEQVAKFILDYDAPDGVY
jgi:hypothetical protein